jgi:hypothetical protein
MDAHYQKVRDYLLELDFEIMQENEEDGVFWVESEDAGIKSLVLGIADPILIMEQFICEIAKPSEDVFKKLLVKNRDIIHGAFVLDETGKNLLFRDTLQIENLDLNELEGSLNSLSLLLSEYSDELIKMSKN